MNANPSYPIDFSSRLTSSRRRPAGSPMAVTKRSAVRILLPLLGMTLALMVPAWASSLSILGVFLPITGNFAAGGQSLWDGIKVANQIEPQVLSRPVRLTLVDTKSDPAGAASAGF